MCYMKKKIAVIAVCLLLVVTINIPVEAQGEAAVPFLLISPNSRASGMGEYGTGIADDAAAIFWNPAGLAFQRGQEVSITHTNWLPQFGMSDLFYDYLNYKNHFESLNGTLAASITYLNLGEHTRTLSSGPEPVGTFKSYEFAVTAGYSTLLNPNLGLGLNLRLIHSSLSPIGAGEEEGKGVGTTVSGDIGILYKTSVYDLPLSFGANLSNLGPKITYIDADQADPIPTNLRLGFGLKLLDTETNALTLGMDFSRILVRRYARDEATGEIPRPDPFHKAIFTAWGDNGLKKVIISGGLEYWYANLIALRAGYFHEEEVAGNRKFLTFGAGIRYDIYGFDFSYIATLEEKHPLSDTLRFTLLISWQ
jgi:hypothetical protein